MNSRKCFAILAILAAFLALTALAEPPSVWASEEVQALGSLKTVPIPPVANLNQFLKTTGAGGVIDPQAQATAIALGKALFWDQSVGSDGQACASCHFNAGADSRTIHQIDPGFRAVPPDPFFSPPFGPGYQLTADDFPFFNPLISDTNDVASSQGVFDRTFVSVDPTRCPRIDRRNIGRICDEGTPGLPFPLGFLDIFAPGRNVEPRNTPTMINAVFNFRNFWDGRARNEFNGVNPIGDLDPFAQVWLNQGTAQAPNLQQVPLIGNLRLENSSLASQAVGPPLSDMEMSFRGRTFADLGKKMLALQNALPSQRVARDDSVLGGNDLIGVRSQGRGINKSYVELIQAAFQDRWWNGGDVGTGFTQMEANFSLFWGLAIQLYEFTLIANDSPFDQAFDAFNAGTAGDPRSCTIGVNCPPGWTAQLQLGLNVFEGKGKCIACHSGPETTNASVRNVQNEKLERMFMGDGGVAVYDNGFYNTAVRKCVGDIHGSVTGECDDAGLGTTIGPLNLPLSMSRFFQLVRMDPQPPEIQTVCALRPEACDIPPVIAEPGAPPDPNLDPNERIAVVGAFKSSGLRNIALQAPFFHNGGDLTLRQVVDFYDRGGNFPELNQLNLDPDIVDLGLTEAEKDALVALMEAMTDERVRLQQAPFDHPQLFLPNLGELRAVGANGSPPLPTFFENLAP